MFGMYGSFQVQPGKRDELAKLLLQAAEALREAEGALAYVVYFEEADSESVSVFEVWEDREAHSASLQLHAVQELISKARPLLAGPPSTQEIEPLGGLGLERATK